MNLDDLQSGDSVFVDANVLTYHLQPHPVSDEQMKTYGFRLILADLNQMIEQLAIDLFEAGCDDGTPHSGEGMAAIDFDREAASLEEAIKSAVVDVEKAGMAVARVVLEGEELATLRTS